jgi:glutaminase
VPTDEENRRADERLEELYERHRGDGDDEPFGLALAFPDGHAADAGDHEARFPLQSISKVFAYALALADHGREEVMRHVGVEPSGDAFNSMALDERHHRPFNPMVNAGALVTTDLVAGSDAAEKAERLVEIMRRYAGNPDLAVDEDTVEREQARGDANRATAYLLRDQDMLAGDVDELLDLYLRQCSVHVSCHDLAVMGVTLANGGCNPLTDERAAPEEFTRDILSVMHSCGMYDFAGEWAYEVGVPAKSGVSGGILGVVPGKMGIGVFSPALDDHGNSVKGVKVCEAISDQLGLHVFATDREDSFLDDG